jgi:DNA topoisomerase IB
VILKRERAGSSRSSPAGRRPAGTLYYVCDQGEGITRERRSEGFVYRHPSGRIVHNRLTLERIRRLAIPPAWQDVWICSDPDGHLQATGRDAKGRKQYKYHQAWREMRDAGKFERLAVFGRALPEIRRKAGEDLAGPGLSKGKVLALVVLLLDETLLRVGNEEYARMNEAYGLTTLRDRHAFVCGPEIRLVFRGKGGKTQVAGLHNRRLARVVKRTQELPGEILFQYVDDEGDPAPITSGDVNEYLRSVAGRDFSAKDFRTWGGTLIAARELARKEGGPDGGRRVAGRVNEAVDTAAAHLGNTRAIARRSYVHTGVIAAFEEGHLEGEWASALAEAAARRQGEHAGHAGETDSVPAEAAAAEDGLALEEEALLTILDRMADASG